MKPWLGFFLFTLGIADSAAECNPLIPATLSSERFDVAAGTVADTDTGLTWLRCSLGQTWDGETCAGEVTSYRWQEALQAAEEESYGAHHDWRLPNRKELASIVEFRCFQPASDPVLWPGIIAARYWSATPFPGSAPLSSWFVDFGDGSYGNSNLLDSYHVVLVRGGEAF